MMTLWLMNFNIFRLKWRIYVTRIFVVDIVIMEIMEIYSCEKKPASHACAIAWQHPSITFV